MLDKKEWNRKYIHIMWIADSSSGLTQLYKVKSLSDPQIILGKVSWYSQWRRYVFFPSSYTLFDSNCLGEIKDFLDQINEEHKRKK